MELHIKKISSKGSFIRKMGELHLNCIFKLQIWKILNTYKSRIVYWTTVYSSVLWDYNIVIFLSFFPPECTIFLMIIFNKRTSNLNSTDVDCAPAGCGSPLVVTLLFNFKRMLLAILRSWFGFYSSNSNQCL